jgi:hypothetical protein
MVVCNISNHVLADDFLFALSDADYPGLLHRCSPKISQKCQRSHFLQHSKNVDFPIVTIL